MSDKEGHITDREARPGDGDPGEQPRENAEKAAVAPGKGVSVPEAREMTRATASDFRHLVARYVRRHLPVSGPSPVPQIAEPPRSTGSSGVLLSLLKVIPLTLGALFVVSFFWDFPGMTLSILGREMVLSGLVRIVAVSGLIGFLTNWIAITMLFNPRTERPLFGQGLIPAQRERVIYRLASAVSEELINEEIIKQKIEENEIIPKYREMALSVTRGVLEDDQFRADLKKLTGDYVQTVLTSDEVRRRIVEFVIEKIENYVGEGMGGFALKAYRYLNEQDFQRRVDRAITMLPDQLDIVLDDMDELLDTIPEKIEARAEDIEEWATKIVLGFVENLDVYSMIMSNMMQYDERRLEDLIKKSTNEQLNYIKYLGGALGALGGLVIWQPVPALVAFGVVGTLLWGADEALYRLRRSSSDA